jgi:hypothetical protein
MEEREMEWAEVNCGKRIVSYLWTFEHALLGNSASSVTKKHFQTMALRS